MANINILVCEAMGLPYYRNAEDDDYDLSSLTFSFPFRARNPENKITASDLAYKAIYGKFPAVSSRGTHRGSTGTKLWKDLLVDTNLQEIWLDRLNSIPGIEIRSLCQGHGPDRPAFVIFRPFKQDLEYIQSVSEKINKCPDTKSTFDLGNYGQYRICASTKNWYQENKSNTKWERWWENLSNCISHSL